MTVRTSKVALNLREKLSALAVKWGLKGRSIAEADTAADVREELGLATSNSPVFGGIYLGGTGAANKLDDYEEGTFTPSITIGGSTTGITYNTNGQEGKYTKIGNRVFIDVNIILTSKGGLTGDIAIPNTALPFDVENAFSGTNIEGAGTVAFFQNLATSVVNMVVQMNDANGAQFNIMTAAATTMTILGGANINDTFSIRFTASYQTAE